MNDKIYVWFSPATDVTGKKLMETLDCAGGTTKPPAAAHTVLCWGTKTDKAVGLLNKQVFNHPDNIRTNRNKFQALEAFAKGKCNVAPFTADLALAGNGDYTYPLVARTNFHQGGAGFWLCLTKSHVQQAKIEGAQYIQQYIDIKDEYRLHVVDGKVVYAVKKTQRDNHKEAFVAHWLEHVENYAAKKEAVLDKATVDIILGRMARKFATGVDMIVRSNTRGWKFSKITLDKLDKGLADEAVKALKAINFDYGAVDCCITTDNKPYVIECNSGPGLEGSSLDAWVDALKKLVTPPEVKKPVAAPAVAEPKQEVVQGVDVKKPAKKAAAIEEAVVHNADKGAKAKLKAKANFLNQMVDAANEEEAAVIAGLWEKMGIIK